MSRTSAFPRLFAAVLCLAAITANRAPAQGNASTAGRSNATTAPSDPKGLKILNLGDYGRWNRVTSVSMSPDGKWMTYAYQPNDGDATLFIKQLDGDKLHTIPVGSAPIFSDDSKWVAYFVSPPERAGASGGRGGRGGGAPPAGAPGGRGAAPAGAATGGGAATRRLELRSLTTGEVVATSNVATFKFSKGSKWLAMKMNRAAGAPAGNGADLNVRDLATGTPRNIGNVNLYEFDDSGKLLAYTVDAAEKIGNGVYLVDPASGETRVLATSAADYDQLIWSETGADLLAMRGSKATEMRQKANALLIWRDLGTPSTSSASWIPESDQAFPRGHVLSEYTAPRWSKDRTRIFVGIKEQETELAAADSLKANVDIWHWKDPETQATQMLRLAQDRRATYPAVYHLATKKFVRLADTSMRTVATTSDGKWGIGRNDAPYRNDPMDTQNRADYYRVNIADGSMTLIDRNLTRTFGASPDGKIFIYLRGKEIRAYDIETAKTTVIGGTTSALFIDEEDDHASDRSLHGIAGWAKGGSAVLLNDKYDIWQVPLDGGKPTNLTNGYGRSQQIVFRIARLTAGGGGRGGRGGGGGAAAGDDEGTDLTKPLTVSAYGDRTKKSGYFEATAGADPKPLIWAEKSIGQAQKADNADRVLLTQQTVKEFPDYWVTSTKFNAPKKVTDANPFITEYAWSSGKVLFDYTNSKGKKLQGTITLPANYEPGKKYPMIVYHYEIMSNTHHTFSMPVYDDRPHMSTYASNGYVVMQPDIVYEIGKPGSSALDCVTAAVKKVIELGYADSKHIGLQGHSWGGYESSFIVTQTDIFAAVVTGAPLTNYISMNNLLYKQTGNINSAILETGQGRMGDNVTPYNSHALWESQSPVYFVNNIKTPFMILQGTADGAVDWNQGLEFFNAARRAGKKVIFLSYPNEPHHLGIKDNQKDFQIRMKQYFDHYLMDKPAPQWMTDGLPQLKKFSPNR